MALFIFALSFLVISGTTWAKNCTNLTIPVQLSVRQGAFDVPEFQDDYDACAFIQNITSISGGLNYTAKVLTGYATISGIYNISAQLCTPDNGAARVVQVLTHGMGIDKSYWHIPSNGSEDSYVDVAVDHYGYATLSYDRLGIGKSSHPDPLRVVQAPAQIEILHQINSRVRNAVPYIPGLKVVNVGHSFGSQLTQQFATTYPKATDAIILQGYSLNTSFYFKTISAADTRLARLNQPLRFGNHPPADRSALLNSTLNLVTQVKDANNSRDGLSTINTSQLSDLVAGSNDPPPGPGQDFPGNYLTWSDVWALQYNYFYSPYFDRALLDFFEAHKQPFAVGEYLTLGSPPNSSLFTGPVQIVTGNQDASYCGGDCSATGLPDIASIPAAAKSYFPLAKAFEAYIHPNSGHAINFHHNATGAHKAMQDFLARNGLKA